MSGGPVAVVTAASRGIGAACARVLAKRGYRLALLARSKDVEVLANELGAVAVEGSVTDPAALDRVVAAAMEAHGRIDALVNNTGHPAKGDLLALSDDDWRGGVDLLLLPVVRLARLVTPILQKQGGGAIVNVSSLWAVEPHLDAPVSSTLRAALSAFTKLYADAHAKAHIRMNNLLPGFIDSYPEDAALRSAIPMGRYGSVAEIAKTTAFLVSDDASYLTGQNIRVDGGLTRSI